MKNQLPQIAEELEHTSPQDILRWGYQSFGSSMAVVTSFQITGIVTIHMLQDIAPTVPILSLDTELLFPETYTLIEQIEQRFNLSVQRIPPQQRVEEQAATYGAELWASQPNLCCQLRKVDPLKAALAQYPAWITGLRRDQSARRANTPIVSWDEQHQNVKIAPFATWTEDMLWLYIHTYELPYNHLHEQGYPSIGCWPCTRPVADGQDPRAGRWTGFNKTECGIHLTNEGEQS